MLRRTGVALATVMLVLPLTVVAQKGGRSRSSLSRSSAKSIASKSTTSSTRWRKSSIPKKSTRRQTRIQKVRVVYPFVFVLGDRHHKQIDEIANARRFCGIQATIWQGICDFLYQLNP